MKARDSWHTVFSNFFRGLLGCRSILFTSLWLYLGNGKIGFYFSMVLWLEERNGLGAQT
jgi:hypothetical protein